MPVAPIALGNSDFRELRERGSPYVDKTGWVRDVVLSGSKVLLFCRPRRFGKTTALRTLQCFLGRSERDAAPLFEGLAIWDSMEARAHFQRYPVLFLTFKDVKAASWDAARADLRGVVRRACEDLRYLSDSAALDQPERERFSALRAGAAPDEDIRRALQDLTGWLARHHGARCVVLVDEYDTPIHTGFAYGYHAEVINFFRTFLNAGLKDNPHLEKGVMTGILRVAKEGLFSDLNHVQVFSVLEQRFGEGFGFTEPEVEGLRATVASDIPTEDLRRWYNGYRFGRHVLYNPWSVLSAFANPEDPLRAYWVATGGVDVLAELLGQADEAVLGDVERWLAGEVVETRVPDSVLLGSGRHQPEDVVTILLHAGYLTALDVQPEDGDWRARLVVPNLEVRAALADAIRRWVSRESGGEAALTRMLRAMIEGDVSAFEELLGGLVERTLAHLDTGGRHPERVYQAFVAGMLVLLERTHRVRTEADSGFGRADVLVTPRVPGAPGVVLEFKRVRAGETLDTAVESALAQIRDRGYAATLNEAGSLPVRAYGVAFEEKRVRVRME